MILSLQGQSQEAPSSPGKAESGRCIRIQALPGRTFTIPGGEPLEVLDVRVPNGIRLVVRMRIPIGLVPNNLPAYAERICEECRSYFGTDILLVPVYEGSDFEIYTLGPEGS